jgi:hypothetical protein
VKSISFIMICPAVDFKQTFFLRTTSPQI